MPGGITASDRKILRIAGAILAVLLTGTVLFTPSAEDSGSTIPSTYSGAPNGAEAAYLLLQELRYPVERWEKPPEELPPPGAHGALLILAEPYQPPTKKSVNRC
jgi:hypothetical protein